MLWIFLGIRNGKQKRKFTDLEETHVKQIFRFLYSAREDTLFENI